MVLRAALAEAHLLHEILQQGGFAKLSSTALPDSRRWNSRRL